MVSLWVCIRCTTEWPLLISDDHKIATWVTVYGGFYSSVSLSSTASGCLVSEDTVCMGAVAGCRAPPPPATCAVKISSKYFYRRGGKYFLSTRYFRQEFFGHIGDTPAVSMGPDAGSMDQTNGEEMLRKQSGNVSSEIKYVSCKSLSSNFHIAE